ncbi:MAG: hypothetical protein K2H18_07990, partial [Muribaculaceae bacterium]|nr:hypothetical protein [Muribaculaceae bacterium]
GETYSGDDRSEFMYDIFKFFFPCPDFFIISDYIGKKDSEFPNSSYMKRKSVRVIYFKSSDIHFFNIYTKLVVN